MKTDDFAKALLAECASCWQWRIDTDPELAVAIGWLEKRRSTHALDPRSLESFEMRYRWVSKAQKRFDDLLARGDLSTVHKDLKLTAELYVDQLKDYVDNFHHRSYLMCINRMEGVQTDLPLYASYLPMNTLSDYKFFESFIEAVPTQIDEVIILLKEGVKQNRTIPQVSMEGVSDTVRKIVTSKAAAFLAPLEKMTPEHSSLKQTIVAKINSSIPAAFQKLADFLDAEYTPNLSTEIASTIRYPEGEKFYADCLAFHTTTTMTPKEVHDLGLSEVNRINDEMKKVALEAGYDDLNKYNEFLRTAEQFSPKDETSLLANYRDICGRIAPELLKIMHARDMPRTPFKITTTPAASAATAPAAFYLAGAGDRPGIFYANTSELSTRRTYECEALSLHEAIPGHHTQAAIMAENSNLQAFQRFQEDRRYFESPSRFPFYTGYIEGWGLHCESLGEELGLYNNPSDKMGMLSMEQLRACRLVVDTGMHAFGWSRDRALKFMLDNTAMAEHDAGCEVTRYER